MRTKELIMGFMLFLTLIGCQEPVEKNREDINQSVVVKSDKNVTNTEKSDLLHQLGFDFKEDKIVIDINKTSNFFETIELKMQERAEAIEQKIEAADINFTKGMGIELKGDQIGVDLNKTKNMLEDINVLMKDIFLDVNKSVQ